MFRFFTSLLTFYTTTRLVRIRSTFLAVVYLVVVTFMWITFFLGWLHLDIRKAYQKSCPVMGVVSAKVKGFASTEHLTLSELGANISHPNLYKRIWDFTDLVSPPFGGEGQYTGFTVATNFVITANQSRGQCAEENQRSTTCKSDKDCEKGSWAPSGHGIYTGKCVAEFGTCEISGWCPIENDDSSQLPFQGKRPFLEGVKDFTVLIKNSVSFPACGNHKGQNIRFKDEHHLRHCIHDPVHQPKCPIFKIGDIVKWSNANFSEVSIKGGVFRVQINWVCDFDFGRSIDDCEPKYSFARVDDKKFTISKGWNFRYADYHEENRRTLHKVYGLQILISAVGEGRKFEFFEAIISLGAMVGLFAVASLLCDFLFDILCLLNSLPCQAMKHYTPELRFGENCQHMTTSKADIALKSDSKKESMRKVADINSITIPQNSPNGQNSNANTKPILLPEDDGEESDSQSISPDNFDS